MKILVYNAKDFEIPFLESANKGKHQLHYTAERLTSSSAMKALGYDAISIFSADDASDIVLEKLKDFGVKFIALRSAGYDNLNVFMANKLGLQAANAPDYSPHAVAEHAIALLQALNRKICRANTQVSNYNFSLSDLVGIDIVGKSVGIIGTGRIGSVIAKIMHGFGARLQAFDIEENPWLAASYDLNYDSLENVCAGSDILFLSVPLNSETHHLINAAILGTVKKNAIIVNVARGAIVDTDAVLKALDETRLRGYATDVYEKEKGVFSYDRSNDKPDDTLLRRLLEHPSTLLTPHQAFATEEALKNIATTTIASCDVWELGGCSKTNLTIHQITKNETV